MENKVKIFLNKTVTEIAESCPRATTDIEENIKNRNWTIKNFAYGPLNPDVPDPSFWEKKAEMWNSDVNTVMSARCCNCAAFDQSPKVINCIIQGINEKEAADPWDVQERANLGYCQLFKFKCAGSRTCDAWLYGGSIQE
jgi:hypothetical protein